MIPPFFLAFENKFEGIVSSVLNCSAISPSPRVTEHLHYPEIGEVTMEGGGRA